MLLSQLSKTLTTVENPTVFVKFDPEVLDFTDKSFVPKLCFSSSNIDFEILLTPENLPGVLTMLKLSVFNKGSKIITWDWKSFVSFILGKTGRLFSVDGSLVDLKLIESYSGIYSKPPVGISEALVRLKNIVSSGIWKDTEHIYKKIFLPLSNVVIPSLENSKLIDTNLGNLVHANYEIDGQINGRLKCQKLFKNGYVPHSMSSEYKSLLKPPNQGDIFLTFDIKGMEVFMLSWLSNDELLKKVCLKPDVYSALYEEITKNSCLDKKNRDFAKKIFLPVIYGQSAYSLSQKCGIAIDAAENLIDNIYKLFPAALAFVESYQKQLQELGYVKDIFGKRRINFEEGKEYAVRNFSIQSPANIVCLEKLIQLFYSLQNKTSLVYTIHDGYVLYVNKDNWKSIYKIGYETLTKESELCPGLNLKVSCQGGKTLNELKSINRTN